MKKIVLIATTWLSLCFSFNTTAQRDSFLQELQLPGEEEFQTIESNLPVRIIREAETRIPGQFNAIILAGNQQISKQNIARYLAKKVNTPIYKIDLSKVISENILETEMNFDFIFEDAKNQNCLLFFDEADALLGNRSDVKDSHTKYDDTGTNYFIGRVEKYRIPMIISVTAKNDINPLIFEKFVRFQVP